MDSQSRYDEKLSGLHKHAHQLRKASTLDEIIDHTAEAMSTTLGFDHGVFCLLEGNFLRYLRSIGDLTRTSGKHLDDRGFTTRAVNTRETQLVPDGRKDKDYDPIEGPDGRETISELDVPVIIDDEVVAVLNVESFEVSSFSERDKLLLETLASHVASSIQRINLLEAKERYEERLKGLHHHASLLGAAESIQKIADHTTDAMNKILELGWCHFYILEENYLKMVSYSGLTPRWGAQWREFKLPLDGKGITVRAAKTNTSQLIHDVREDPSYIGAETDEDGASIYPSLSELAVPVIADDEVLAVLNTESPNLNEFLEQDQELLETLASHVASAIQRIRLLEAKQQYELKLEALNGHATELEKAESLQEISEITADTMSKTLGFKQAGFGVVEENVLKVILRWGYEIDPRDYSLDGPGIIVRAIRTGEIQIIQDTRLDDDYYGPPHMLSELVVPVRVEEIPVATLYILSEEADAITNEDQKLLEILANHVASAITRIRARDAVKRLAYRLNALVPGGCYLSHSNQRCLKAYAILSMQGVPGLCIVREDPQRLVESYGIKAEEITLLSSRPFRDFETISNLQAVSLRISQFLESGRGVVLFDGLEYLITRFGFETVYRFIQEKRFDILESGAVLIVPLDMETLDDREKALLSSEFNILE